VDATVARFIAIGGTSQFQNDPHATKWAAAFGVCLLATVWQRISALPTARDSTYLGECMDTRSNREVVLG